MTDLELYNKNKQPPQWALKQITGGRLKGMTDIKPQWRIDVLTETFGLCGFGWYPEIVRQWIETTATGEIVANTQINLYICKDGQWSKPIPAIGGAMLVANEKNGLYTSDEAYKMSYTDALSVACKQLGIAGEIYRGNAGRSKYEQYENGVDSLKKEIKSEKAKATREFNKRVQEYQTSEEGLEIRYKNMYRLIQGMPQIDQYNRDKVLVEKIMDILDDLKKAGNEKAYKALNDLANSKMLKQEPDEIPANILEKGIKPEEFLQAG